MDYIKLPHMDSEVSVFAVCQAHQQLEADYNVGGILRERPSNKRRNESTGVQLARMGYLSSSWWVDIENLEEDENPDDEAVRDIYILNVLNWKLPIGFELGRLINEHYSAEWLDEHTGPVFQNMLMTCAAFAGVALALFLFTFLPTFLTGQLIRFIPLGRWGRVILEGALKMAIFLLYMFLCTRMKELHRVFEYHGAEHKTIACYEAGLPLTVENIRKQSRFHPRCGTSFMILVIIISIFLYAVLPWTSTGLRIVYKLCMFPLLVGVCYEILKWAGRSHSMLSRIVSQPGLWMQRLTTFEPDDSMIEVAIAAVTPVLPENQEEARW